MRTSVQLQIAHEEIQPGTVIVRLAGRLMLGPDGAQLEAVVKALLATGVLAFNEATYSQTISSVDFVMALSAIAVGSFITLRFGAKRAADDVLAGMVRSLFRRHAAGANFFFDD